MIYNMVGTGGGGASKMPEFEYTGSYQLLDDGKEGSTQNWRIKFLTSGVFTTKRDMNIDVFLVGGGGGGSYASSGGGGGGGGYTKTVCGVDVSANTAYGIVVGAGGEAQTSGGSSSAFEKSVSGGDGASGYDAGSGGSGGGGGVGYGNVGHNGGSDGSNGGSGNDDRDGAGQGTTTREFGELDGDLYAGGGGAGGGASGGAGGGGDGYISGTGDYTKINGTANSGGGGGGDHSEAKNCGVGGSGIVVIRNHRAAV